MPNNTYHAAVVGLGFVGGGDPESGDRIGQKVEHLDGYHRQALSRHPRIELRAGCDLDVGRRERFARRTGARVYSDWRKMLAEERPEIVSVATTAPTHAEITIGCAELGVRVVYCEKPMACSVEEGERMLAACTSRSGSGRSEVTGPGSFGTLLVINHNRRFNPAYRRLRGLIAGGGLGELTSVALRWGSGRLGCVGTHLIDAARMLTGREVAAVAAVLDEGEKPDCRGPDFHDPGGWALLRFGGGLMGLLSAGNKATGPAEVVIDGTLGRAVTGGRSVTIQWFGGQTETWPMPDREISSMDRAVAEILDWLDDPGDFGTPAVEALRTLEVIAACHASHAAGGGWVELPLEGKQRSLCIRCA